MQLGAITRCDTNAEQQAWHRHARLCLLLSSQSRDRLDLVLHIYKLAQDVSLLSYAMDSVIDMFNYDIVALQELWVSADYGIVRTTVEKQLPYAKFFYR